MNKLTTTPHCYLAAALCSASAKGQRLLPVPLSHLCWWLAFCASITVTHRVLDCAYRWLGLSSPLLCLCYPSRSSGDCSLPVFLYILRSIGLHGAK